MVVERTTYRKSGQEAAARPAVPARAFDDRKLVQ
jgi:hypothetical protein